MSRRATRKCRIHNHFASIAGSSSARFLAAAVGMAFGCAIQAQPSTPGWSKDFAGAGMPSDYIYAMLQVPESGSNVVYATGGFLTVGGRVCSGIAKWNGNVWSPLGSGPNLGFLGGKGYALTMFDDDGAGPHAPALFVAGDFDTAGGVLVRGIAKWNGSQFEALPGGSAPTIGLDGTAFAMQVFGGRLFVAGTFNTAGGVSCPGHIAYWDPQTQSWHAGPTGANAPVRALRVYGGELYAGGDYDFTVAGGPHIRHLGKVVVPTSGSPTWADVGGGIDGNVRAMEVYDVDGAGPLAPRLFVGGAFGTVGAGQVTAHNIACWNGSNWSASSELAGGTNGEVLSLLSYKSVKPGQVQDCLYIGGNFGQADGNTNCSNIAAWTRDGGWSALDLGFTPGSFIFALSGYDPAGATSPTLLAARVDGIRTSQQTMGPVQCEGVAQWDVSAQAWKTQGHGANGTVNTITYHDGKVILTGDFTAVNGRRAYRIAQYNNGTLESLLPGSPDACGVSDTVRAAASWDPDGSGPAAPRLVIGGDFIFSTNGTTVHRAAMWTGTAWVEMGGGFSDAVYALKVYDGNLYAAGNFDYANPGVTGGTLVKHIARWVPSTTPGANAWDGQWVPISVGSVVGVDSWAHALQVYDDGSGPSLFVGGQFLSAGNVQAHGIARFKRSSQTGDSWAALGAGTDGLVETLHVHTDPTNGTRLYVGGRFNYAGGIARKGIASWHGPTQTWSSLDTGLNGWVYSMASFDIDGGGPKLYIAGEFGGPASLPNCANIARWNGQNWERVLVSGLTSPPGFAASVNALTVIDHELLVGGEFYLADGSVSSERFTKLSRCYVNCDNSTAPPILNALDFQCFLNKFATATAWPAAAHESAYANCDNSTSFPVLNVLDFTCFLTKYAAGCT